MKKHMLKTAFFSGMIFIIGLTSCQLTRKYQAPVIDTTGLFRDEDMPVDTFTIADIPWRSYFPDPYLQILIEEGLLRNYDLRIAYTRIQQAEANLNIARLAYFPDIALAEQVTHNRFSNGERGKDVLGYHTNQYTLGIGATWEADLWGRLSAQSRAQFAQFLNSEIYSDLVMTSLIANIATSYYSLLALDEQLRITRSTAKVLEQSSETMQALMEAGMLTAASVEQSKALYYATLVTIPDLETSIRQTEDALSVLLGRKPQEILRSTLENQDVNELMYHGVPMQMLSRRPDVQQAELSFRAAFELTSAAMAAFYPSITLGTGSAIGYGSNTLSSFFKPENIFLNLIGGITQPIFARGQLKGNLAIAKAQQEEALLTFEQTVLNAGQEVSDILFSFQASLTKNPIRNEQIESLQRAVYYTQELLKAGEANYTEVLTAQQNLLSAQLSQVNDKLEQLQYGVNLYRALGGGTR
ncbi:MAG: TolC family protein [Candidatus Azobacteroides sp.]|nr:TolC family protein [Candidatus Azobacteroides sp.]